MINLPQKQWSQANQSDLYGNISVTKNITFDQEGYLKLSNSPRAVMDENITADFNNPAVILYSEDFGYFTATWDSCFRIDRNILAVRPTGITFAPGGDIQSDAVFFGGLMPVSQSNNLYYYNPATDTWTDTNISLTSTIQGQHALVNFISLSALAVANINTVRTYSSPLTATPTLLNTLTILSDFYITGMCYFNQNLYIATMNRFGGHAYMYVWDGSGTAAQNAYEVDSNMIFSICAYQDSVALVTANGSLLRFNGSGFDALGHFPIYYTDRALTDESNIGMYKNILKSNGDLLYILFTDRSNNIMMLNQPNGIWCYDPKVGLYHRYSLSNSLVSIQEGISDNDIDIVNNKITVASPAVATGTEVYYQNNGLNIGGLTHNTKYYVINIDSTHIKLALTKALALAGTPIDLTGTGNPGQVFIFFPNIDYGQFFLARTMALGIIERPVDNTQYGTDLIWGAEVPQRQLTGADGMLGTVSNGVESRGYFIIPKVFSQNVTDTFNQVVIKFSEFTSELDKIILKYRTTDDRRDTILDGEWLADWTSTTTFTTTQPDFINAQVGDEIEILTGAGAGLLAHIVIITGTSTFTVTIDETYDNYISGDKCTVVFRNWIKFATIDITNTDAFLSQQLGVTGKFIQLKIELRGLGVRVEELSIDNKYSLPSKI